MNWNHWRKELSSQIADFEDDSRGVADPMVTPFSWMIEEDRLRDKIDSACRHFAAKAQWPSDLALKEKALIYFRLKVAEEHAREQVPHQPSQAPSSAEVDSEREEALTMLLVDYWIPTGRNEWLNPDRDLTS